MKNYKQQWEAKQAEITELINKEVEGRTERIEILMDEIHELMRLDYEQKCKYYQAPFKGLW